MDFDPVSLTLGALASVLALFVGIAYLDAKLGLPTSYVNWAIVLYVLAVASAILVPALKG